MVMGWMRSVGLTEKLLSVAVSFPRSKLMDITRSDHVELPASCHGLEEPCSNQNLC